MEEPMTPLDQTSTEASGRCHSSLSFCSFNFKAVLIISHIIPSQIDKTSFEKTKLLDQSFLDYTSTYFEVDWSETQWEDLLKPFHSALATYLYLEYLDKNVFEKLTHRLEDQANVWKLHFSEQSDANIFKDKANELDEGRNYFLIEIKRK